MLGNLSYTDHSIPTLIGMPVFKDARIYKNIAPQYSAVINVTLSFETLTLPHLIKEYIFLIIGIAMMRMKERRKCFI